MRGGVLAIGSLYWCSDPSRTTWRSSRLRQDQEHSVLVPIRYGRKSRSRQGTYTMVFSLLCLRRSHGLGVAKAIPLRNDTQTSDELISEAELMWAAECRSTESDGSLSSCWGTVALLINPNSDIPDNILTDWSNRIARETHTGHISHTRSEPQVVSTDGLLRIPWPETVQKTPLEFDFLLATATKPLLHGKPPTYPRIRDVALAWKRDRHENVDYFWKNRASGIQTYQDGAIMKYLPGGRSA